MTKLYQNYTAYPGASPLTLQNSLVALEAGPGFVNHIGHGFRYNMSVGDLSLLTHHAVSLDNSDSRFVLYFLNCTAAAFDFPCLAEAYLEAPGGAVAVLGATRAAFPLPSRNYNIGFFQAMYNALSGKNVGVLFTISRLAYTPYATYDTSDHYTHFLYNLLGDPEMVVHTRALQSTGVSAPASLGLGLTQVLVTVTNNGVARQDALVCLQKGTEEYVHGRTNASGQVTLAFVAETAGNVMLTASGQNMTTWVSNIPVTASVAPYVHVQSLSVDDDNNGGTLGNGDGRIDSGEIVALNLTIANSGNGAAAGVSGVLRLNSPWATVQDSTYNVGGLGSGGSALVSGEVRFAVAASAPDGAVLDCRFASTNGSTTWNDRVNRVLHAPGMQLVLVDVLDPLPGGNNDGAIQAGETFDLVPSFKNYGSGSANGLQATLLSSDPDIVLSVNQIAVGNVAPLQELTAAQSLPLAGEQSRREPSYPAARRQLRPQHQLESDPPRPGGTGSPGARPEPGLHRGGQHVDAVGGTGPGGLSRVPQSERPPAVDSGDPRPHQRRRLLPRRRPGAGNEVFLFRHRGGQLGERKRSFGDRLGEHEPLPARRLAHPDERGELLPARRG